MFRFRILLFFLALSLTARSQNPPLNVIRGYPSVVNNDARLKVQLNLSIPVVADTAHGLNGGLDSLGLIIQIRNTGDQYKRDTTPGGHKWSLIGSGVAQIFAKNPLSILGTDTVVADTNASHLTALATIAQLYHLRDSLGNLADTLIILRTGGRGDSIIRGSGQTIFTPGIVDSGGFVHAMNPDGSITFFSPTAVGGSPGGSNMDVQYNNSGSFGGSSGRFVWDNTNKRVSIFNTSLSGVPAPSDHALQIIGSAVVGDTSGTVPQPAMIEFLNPYPLTRNGVRGFFGWYGTLEMNYGFNLNYRNSIHQSFDTTKPMLYSFLSPTTGFGFQGVGMGHSNFSSGTTKQDVYTLFGKVPFRIDWLMNGNDYAGSRLSTNILYLYDQTTTNQNMDAGTKAIASVSSAAINWAGVPSFQLSDSTHLGVGGNADPSFMSAFTITHSVKGIEIIDNAASSAEMIRLDSKNAGSHNITAGTRIPINFQGGIGEFGGQANSHVNSSFSNIDFYWKTTLPAGGAMATRMMLLDTGFLLVGRTTDNGSGAFIQDHGRIAVETIDSTGAPPNMLYADPVTGVFKKAAVPVGGAAPLTANSVQGDGTSINKIQLVNDSSLTSPYYSYQVDPFGNKRWLKTPSLQTALNYNPEAFTANRSQDLSTFNMTFTNGTHTAFSMGYGSYQFFVPGAGGNVKIVDTTNGNNAFLTIGVSSTIAQIGAASGGLTGVSFTKPFSTSDAASTDMVNYGFNGGKARWNIATANSSADPFIIFTAASTGNLFTAWNSAHDITGAARSFTINNNGEVAMGGSTATARLDNFGDSRLRDSVEIDNLAAAKFGDAPAALFNTTGNRYLVRKSNLGTFFSQTAAGTAVTNTTTQTTIMGAGQGSMTVAANSLQVGQVIHIHGWAKVSTDVGAQTFGLWFLNSNSSSSISTSLAGSLTSAWMEINLYGTITSTGSSGNMSVMGTYAVNNGSPTLFVGSTTVGINTTTTQTFDLQAVWGTVSTSNSIQSQNQFSFQIE